MAFIMNKGGPVVNKERSHIRTHILAILLAAASTVGIFYIVLSPLLAGDSAIRRTLPIYSVQREYKTVALTFNASDIEDGSTTDILAALESYGIKATFFVTGQWAEANPALLIQIAASGHEIMNLSDDYSDFKRMTASQMQANIAACSDKIETLTGVRPTLFRAPYGVYDDHVVTTVNALGLTMIQWDVDSRDAAGLSASAITRRVSSKIQPGSIVMFHCGKSTTAEAMPGILRSLLQDGYSVTPVSNLILTSEYTVSATGRQMPA